MAAKRQGHVVPSSSNDNHLDNPVLARAAVPLKDTQYAILEATRRPAAALRSGLAVDDFFSSVLSTPAVTAAVAAAAGAAKPVSFGATSAGAMEARRRHVAANRLGIRRQYETTATTTTFPSSPNTVVALDINLVDTEYYAMEATRRPRAMARLRKQRGSMSVNDLAAAAATATAVEREVAAAAADLVNNSVNVAKMKLDNKNGEGPNPFASLERMLESRLSESNLNGMAGGRKSRGSSLRGAANYPGSPGVTPLGESWLFFCRCDPSSWGTGR